MLTGNQRYCAHPHLRKHGGWQAAASLWSQSFVGGDVGRGRRLGEGVMNDWGGSTHFHNYFFSPIPIPQPSSPGCTPPLAVHPIKCPGRTRIFQTPGQRSKRNEGQAKTILIILLVSRVTEIISRVLDHKNRDYKSIGRWMKEWIDEWMDVHSSEEKVANSARRILSHLHLKKKASHML